MSFTRHAFLSTVSGGLITAAVTFAVARHSAAGAALAAAAGAMLTGGAGWFLLRGLERGLDELVDIARTGVGATATDDPVGRVRGAIAAREYEQASTADQLRRERLSAWEALDTSPLGVVLLDPERRISWVNQSFGKLLPVRADPVGRRLLEVLSVVELHEVTDEVFEHGEPAERRVTTQTHDLSLRAERLPNGLVVARIEDVTQAREAERSRTDFVANVSHELRTPVASVLGYLDLALSDRDRIPDDIVPLLETALRNGTRLRDLFEDLLKLHRIEARRRELPIGRHRLDELVQKAVGAVRDKAAMRGQELVVDVPSDLQARVNPEALGQILSNLASNASAYSPEGTRIDVRARERGDGVQIDVIDQGIGIAPRHQERIFERFFRVDEARSRTIGGTGLGLAIVKHYAKASGCHITLESKEGSGTTFSVHLPR